MVVAHTRVLRSETKLAEAAIEIPQGETFQNVLAGCMPPIVDLVPSALRLSFKN